MGKYLFVVFSIFVSGCAHHRDVRPGASGIHSVRFQTEDKDEGAREAIKQADHYCKERGLSAAFVDEKQSYTGDMDEQSYKTLKKAGKVAQVAGASAYVLGGKRESSVGGVVGLGGIIAGGVAGKGYTIEMKFKCI